MEIEGEIIGFVLVFILLSGAFYFFVTHGSDEKNSINQTVPIQENLTEVEENVTSNIPEVVQENLTETENVSTKLSFENISFVHWDHMPITYHFTNDYSNCSGAPINTLVEAFDLISEKTGRLVNFSLVSSNENADINLTCAQLKPILEELKDDEECENISVDYRSVQIKGYEYLKENDYLISFTRVSQNDTTDNYKLCYVNKNIATSNYSLKVLDEAKPKIANGVIVSGEKTIFSADSGYKTCLDFPASEVHDILHLLGFAHSDVPEFDEYYGWFSKDLIYFKDVMFPYTYCSFVKELNQNYVDCLKYIYSNGAQGKKCEEVNFAG